jgi:hypothetical protein
MIIFVLNTEGAWRMLTPTGADDGMIHLGCQHTVVRDHR